MTNEIMHDVIEFFGGFLLIILSLTGLAHLFRFIENKYTTLLGWIVVILVILSGFFVLIIFAALTTEEEKKVALFENNGG